MAVVNPQTIPAGDIFSPVDPTPLPAGFIVTDEMSTTRQSYTSAAVDLWNVANRYTKQGQKWAAVSGDATQGVQNRATGRGVLGSYAHHVTEVEFLFTGNRFDVQFRGTSDSAWDCTVWIEVGGRMRRLSQYPKGFASGSGMRYRNVEIDPTIPYHGRVRVHVAAGIFVGIGHEANAIIRPAPPRFYGITDGDSYVDGQQAQNAGAGEGYFSMGLVDHLFEKTGWAFGRRAMGGTAPHNNGGGYVNNDVATFLNTTRWFSGARKAWMVNTGPAPYDFSLPIGQRPQIFLINGTWNEPSANLSDGQHGARMKLNYQWIQQMDPWITTVHVLCEPFWGDGAGGFGAVGTSSGPPGLTSPHYREITESIEAAGEVPRTKIINPFGFVNGSEPWWAGKGDSTTLATDPDSQQAQLTGADHIHGNYRGYQHYAGRIAAELALIRLPLPRVKGFL